MPSRSLPSKSMTAMTAWSVVATWAVSDVAQLCLRSSGAPWGNRAGAIAIKVRWGLFGSLLLDVFLEELFGPAASCSRCQNVSGAVALYDILSV